MYSPFLINTRSTSGVDESPVTTLSCFINLAEIPKVFSAFNGLVVTILIVAPNPPVGRIALADLYTSTAATPDDEISPKSNDLPPTHKGGTVGIDLPLRVTKLNSGPRPLTVTEVLSPLSLLVVTPTNLDNASAIFLSANLPISSAVIASTTPTLSLLIEIASIKLDLIPVVTTSSTAESSDSSS